MQNITSLEQVKTNFVNRRKLVCRFWVLTFCHEYLFQDQQIKLLSEVYVNYILELLKADDSSIVTDL